LHVQPFSLLVHQVYTTPFTFMAQVGERHVPGYNAPNFCDLMNMAPFAD